MKKLLLTTLVTMSLSVGAFAQGFLYLDTWDAGPYLYSGAYPGVPFTGNVNIQIWVNPTGSIMGAQSLSTYNDLSSLGYLNEGTVTMTTDVFGLLSSSTPYMLNDVTTYQASMPMVLVAWTGSSSWFNGLGAIYGFTGDNLGFMDGGRPNPDAGTGLDTVLAGSPNAFSIIMTPIPAPEPGTLSLAIMGVGGLFSLRYAARKKSR